jgi:lysophospholipase L1-like esterase
MQTTRARSVRAFLAAAMMGCVSGVPVLAGEAPTAPPALPHVAARIAAHAPLRIIAFGSSSTWGAGASSQAASYPARLDGELHAALPGESITIENRGVGGEDAEDFARRLAGVIAAHPDLVILQTGTNDPLRDLPLARFVSLTHDFVAALQQNGIDVILMEPQQCRVFDAKAGSLAYRDAVRRIGAEMSVSVIRRYDLMREWHAHGLLTTAQMQAPDGLHMTDGGYALLAKAVSRAILQLAAMRGA